jgi:hypothetical protein
MILTKTEMVSAPGQTFMLTASVAKANLQPKTKARIQQNALKTVRFAECGLFA